MPSFSAAETPRTHAAESRARHLTVRQIATPQILSCPPSTPIAEAAAAMRRARCSSPLVSEAGVPVGIWTERDALRLDLSDPANLDQPIATVMSAPVKCIHGDAPVSEAGLRFKQEKIRHLVVLGNDATAVGLLSQTDVILNHGVEHYLTFRDVRSVMSSPPPRLAYDTPLKGAVRCLAEARSEVAIVQESGQRGPGIITERDLVRLVAERRIGGVVGDQASRPLITVPPNATLLAARDLFAQHGVRHLLVADGGEILGLLSFTDILTTLHYEYSNQLNAALEERDRALNRSRHDLILARQVIEASLEGVMIVDENGLIEYVNPAFTRITGYGAKEAIGQPPSLLKSGRHDAAFYQGMWLALRETGGWQGEVWNRRKDGSLYAEWLSINAIREGDHVVRYSAIFSDITARKEQEEHIQSLAYFDTLTGLPNRRLLLDRIGVAVANAHRHASKLAVMFLDLDLFKGINDTLGHAVGDQVLVETATRLQDCLREGDTVARIGGDEFVLLLPELDDPADASRLAERIIAAIRAPLSLADRQLYVTTSVGIAIYPDDGSDAETLLKCADAAMYQAKQLGRNKHSLPARASGVRSSLEDRLRNALERDELSLAYQVKVDMTTGRVSGAEALVRWTPPDFRPVPPSELLPLVERMGLMPSLGSWVLTTACRQLKQWQDRGLPEIRMAVNIAPSQFRDDTLATVVERVLAETGVAAHHLELELTESAVLAHPEEVSKALNRLHDTGVRLIIDDFGVQHSHLRQLFQLPIHALKIDPGFITGLHSPFNQKDLIAALVGLAHTLGLKAVAEGVASTDQVDFLRRVGCDEIQGYLISRALSAADVVSLFDRKLLPSAPSAGQARP